MHICIVSQTFVTLDWLTKNVKPFNKVGLKQIKSLENKMQVHVPSNFIKKTLCTFAVVVK